MAKTVKRTRSVSKSRKNVKSRSQYNQTNQQTILLKFLATMNMVKLFHWKTHSFATHKATDELYESLNGNIDKFIEVLLGKTGSRIDLMGHKTISLIDLNSQEQLKSKIESFKSYLVGLTNNKGLGSMTNKDLLNIRDEILGDMNQFLYLLTFK